MRALLAVSLVLLAAPSLFAIDAADVAFLVLEEDRAAVVAGVTEGLQSPDALTRATAARVATVRDLTELAPAIMQLLASEADAIAAREEIRAGAILSAQLPIDALFEASKRFPSSMDGALSDALARRSPGVLDLWGTKLRELRSVHARLFETALWGRVDLAASVGSRFLREREHRGWALLLDALRDASIAPDAGIVVAGLGSQSEEIRTETVWFLARAYVIDPKKLPQLVRDAILAEGGEEGSDREEFGRELLRRMASAAPRSKPRWIEWLATPEADDLLKTDDSLDHLLTLDELRVRTKRCGLVETRCPAPSTNRRTIPSTRVREAEYWLPDLLPRGLADRVLQARKCRAQWVGLATTKVDRAGRVQTIDLGTTQVDRLCVDPLKTLMRLTLVRNTSLASAFTNDGVLLVKPKNVTPCIDEHPPGDEVNTSGVLPVGGEIKAPVVLKRYEPEFPESARRAMGAGRNVIVIMETIITKEGCVRGARLLTQSPYGELNAAALLAVSKWKFSPGRLDGKPVDVIFNLTVNFKLGM
jgi:TonB family protein